MRYLKNSDYKYKITRYDLETLLQFEETNPDRTIFDAELKAQEQISLFLRKRYDLNLLFKTYTTYQNGLTYATGDTVWYSTGDTYNFQLYKPTGSTSNLPTSIDWMVTDPRYASVLDWMITISLYKLHERLAPDNIPKHRKDAYDEVMSLLKRIQEGKLSPEFPEIEDRIQNIYIGGSETTGIGEFY